MQKHGFGKLAFDWERQMYIFTPGNNFSLIPTIKTFAAHILEKYQIRHTQWSLQNLHRLCFFSNEQPYSSQEVANAFGVGIKNISTYVSDFNDLLQKSRVHIASGSIDDQGQFTSRPSYRKRLDYQLQWRTETEEQKPR